MGTSRTKATGCKLGSCPVVRASWEDYVGPEVDPKTVMPMIPEPDHAVQDPRPYVMRGAAFSKTVAFVVDGKRR